MNTAVMASPLVRTSVERLVGFLESGDATDLFDDEVFSDVSLPHWRVQAEDAAQIVAVRQQSHPYPGRVRVEKVLDAGTGYAVKLEERWEDGGQEWYCRESFICELDQHGRIIGFDVYCTGDWDEAAVAAHAQAVTLIRP